MPAQYEGSTVIGVPAKKTETSDSGVRILVVRRWWNLRKGEQEVIWADVTDMAEAEEIAARQNVRQTPIGSYIVRKTRS